MAILYCYKGVVPYSEYNRGAVNEIMPYFIYKIAAAQSSAAKQLEMQKIFESFKDAKNHARELRAGLQAGSDTTIKVIFAENETQAKEQLVRKKEKPIQREWE